MYDVIMQEVFALIEHFILIGFRNPNKMSFLL